jgi:hypothetical protein
LDQLQSQSQRLVCGLLLACLSSHRQ